MSNQKVLPRRARLHRRLWKHRPLPNLRAQAARIAAGLNGLMLVSALGLGVRFVQPGMLNEWLSIFFLISLNTIIYSLLAVAIISRHPGHTVGWLFLIVGLSFGLAELQRDVVELALGLPIHSELWRGVITLVGHMVWIPWLLIPISLVLLYFPDGRLPSRRWWPVTAATLLALGGMQISMALEPWETEIMRSTLDASNPLGIAGSQVFFDRLYDWSSGLFGFAVAASWVAVAVRFYRSEGTERIQMKWLIYSAGVTILALMILSAVLFDPFISEFVDVGDVGIQMGLVLPILLPVTIGIAILRYNWFDIDIVIQRTLVYGGLSLSIVAIYVVVVGALGLLFQTQGNYLVALLATGLSAVLFQPVRSWLQRQVSRRLYGERDDPAAVFSQLAHHVETAGSATAILPNLVQTIAHTLKIPYAAIWLPVADRMEAAAVWGEMPEHSESIALTYQNEAIGHLVVAPRGPRERFNKRERELLEAIAALTATTVRAVQLSDEVRQSRRRIVSAREEERRRIRRDLHDGLGPQLASQVLSLEAVAQLISGDVVKAQSVLESLKTQAEDAIRDVRGLVYDLRPPALDDLGLVGALRQSISHFGSSKVRFRLDVPDDFPVLPVAVETAIYRIAQEAMTNVVRHAGATHCTIRLYTADRQSVVEIDDDGQGLPAERRSGVGLQAMQERAAELNGELSIEVSPEGGVLVRAMLPVEISHE